MFHGERLKQHTACAFPVFLPLTPPPRPINEVDNSKISSQFIVLLEETFNNSEEAGLAFSQLFLPFTLVFKKYGVNEALVWF